MAGTDIRKPESDEKEKFGAPDRKSPGDIAMEDIKVTLHRTPPTEKMNIGSYEKGTAKG